MPRRGQQTLGFGCKTLPHLLHKAQKYSSSCREFFKTVLLSVAGLIMSSRYITSLMIQNQVLVLTRLSLCHLSLEIYQGLNVCCIVFEVK